MNIDRPEFEMYLTAQNEQEWLRYVQALLPSIHPVDRNATQIWFRFHSSAMHTYFASAEDIADAQKGIAFQGEFGLSEKVDTSHQMLYGHRYWPTVKAVIEREATTFTETPADLESEIVRIAEIAAKEAKADVGLLIGITAVGLATLAQVGPEKFAAAPGNIQKPKGLMTKSPDAIVKSRSTNDSQGILGFLKTVNRKFSVIYDEAAGGRFDILAEQEIASASANDRSQNWREKDERCWEGPVPVECTSASCGTCWVGILAGEKNLSEVSRRERRAIKVFGYDDSDSEKPIIRLACQARASGNITLVIPPWNAVFGKKVYGNIEELELEPVTTSAKALRRAVRDAKDSETK